ncbi:MAG: hypothetical protein WDN29_02195 [Methylovirgula sp.]
MTVGDRNVPALQLWIACNFVSMALILVLGMRLGWGVLRESCLFVIFILGLRLDGARLEPLAAGRIITVRLVMGLAGLSRS